MAVRWRELELQEFAYLDTLDLKPFLQSEESVHSVMDKIEESFQEEYRNKTGDEYLFNAIGDYEFAQYLKKRYDTNTYEYTELRIR